MLELILQKADPKMNPFTYHLTLPVIGKRLLCISGGEKLRTSTGEVLEWHAERTYNIHIIYHNNTTSNTP